jgi:16S rRNA processing protein RimM
VAAAALDDSVRWPEDAVEVGRIVDAWGLKGGIKVLPFSSDPQALFSSRRWFVKPPEAAFAGLPVVTGVRPGLLRVISAREQGDVIVAIVQDVADRNAAEALRGCRVFVSRSSFPSTDVGEYYWIDLIGLDVVNRDDVLLGRVADLLDTGAHSVLRVVIPETTADGKVCERERLIPFVAAYIDTVSLEARRITVDWGLDY